jgi:hypothetical protein
MWKKNGKIFKDFLPGLPLLFRRCFNMGMRFLPYGRALETLSALYHIRLDFSPDKKKKQRDSRRGDDPVICPIRFVKKLTESVTGPPSQGVCS